MSKKKHEAHQAYERGAAINFQTQQFNWLRGYEEDINKGRSFGQDFGKHITMGYGYWNHGDISPTASQYMQERGIGTDPNVFLQALDAFRAKREGAALQNLLAPSASKQSQVNIRSLLT